MSSDVRFAAASVQHVPLCIDGLAIRTKFWFEIDGRFVVGEHGLDLLAAIDRTGSIAQAARSLGWSYRHAWGYVKQAEATLGRRLLVSRAGRGAAKGTQLSEQGIALLRFGLEYRERRANKPISW